MFDAPPQHYFYQHFQVELHLPLAGIIKIPTGNQGEVSYKNLICTDDDKAIIFEVISTLADNGKFDLLAKQRHLRRLEVQINHVHPFKFLGTIFSNPKLKARMIPVFDDFFKRAGFMDGLGPSLTREASKGKLLQYLDDFAMEVNVNSADIRTLYQNKDWNSSDWEMRDWEKLVRFLIDS